MSSFNGNGFGIKNDIKEPFKEDIIPFL